MWLGKKENVEVYVKDDIYLTVPKRKKKQVKAYIEYNGPVKAPVEKDSILGELKVYLNDELYSTHDVYSSEKIKKVNVFARIIKSFNFLVWGDV